MRQDFDLWLEFEQWIADGSENPQSDFFNAMVTLPTGEKYALNVWTFGYLEVARRNYEETGDYLCGKYLPPPDLFVTRLDRSHIEEVIADLLKNGCLRAEWLVPGSG